MPQSEDDIPMERVADPRKATYRAPAESLPVEEPGLPETEGDVGPDEHPAPEEPPDGGEDYLSGLPRNYPAQRVAGITEQNRPDVPKTP